MLSDRRRRIPDKEWEQRKEILRQLYLAENRPLTATGGVMDIMASVHKFSASKSQYETRLKKVWGFRKYSTRLNNEESGQVRAHRQVNRDTGSLLSGAQSALRQGFPPPLCASSDFSQSENPDSIFMPARSTLAIRNSPSPRATGPVLQFQSRPQTVAASPSNNVLPTSPFGLNSLINPIESWWDSLPNNEQHNPGTSNPDQSLSISDDYAFSNVPSWPQALVHFALPEETGNAPQSPWIKLPITRVAAKEYVHKGPSFLMSITRMFIESLTAANRYSSSLLAAGLPVSALPPQNTYSAESLLLLHKESVDFQFLHMMVDHLVNAGTNIRPSQMHTKNDSIFDQFMNQGKRFSWRRRTDNADQLVKIGLQYIFSLPVRILNEILDSFPELYSSALQQSLFCAAIKSGATHTMDLILSRGFNIDRPFWFDYHLLYPLEVACDYGQVEITRTLLMHGANPNKFTGVHPLRWSAKKFSTRHPVTTQEQLIRLLLIHGATLRTKDAPIVIQECSNHLVPLFVQSALEKGFNAFVESGALAAMLWRTDWGTELATTLRMVVNYHRAGPSRLSYTCNKELGTAILVATIQGRLDAIDLLLQTGALSDPSCLIKAVQTGNISILERFLDLGIDPNLVGEQKHYKIPGDFLGLLRCGRCTALSESIRCGFKEIFDVLERRNCLTEFGKNYESFDLVLIESCRSGNESLVRKLLSNQVSKHHHCTSKAYLAAIETGNEAMVMILVSAGIPLDTTVMISAIQQKRSTLISLFAHIMDLTEVRYRTERHTCILHEAVMWGDISVFDMLVRAGASLDTNFLLSPQQRRDLGIETLLDEFGRHVNWLADSLSVAVLKENAEMINVMLASGAVLNANWVSRIQEGPEAGSTTVKMTPLTACVIKQNRGLAQLLLDRGMDPLDNAALYMAVVLDAEDMIRFLISAFVHRYSSGERSFGTMALISAIRADQYHIVDLLIDVVGLSTTLEQQTVKKYGMTKESISPVSEVVRLACERGNIPDHLDNLLHRQKDPNSTVYSSYSIKLTALQYAITLKSLPVVRLLIEDFGADASSQALYGADRTPLQAAVETGDSAMVQYLIDRGATVKDQPAHKNGATALQLAAIQDLAAIAVILLENGADVNADPALINGRTAFEGATEHGHIDMMRFLVQNGADLVANDQQQHRRAVDYAKRSGQYAAIELANSLLQECLRGEHGIPASFGVGSTPLFGFEEGSSM